MSKETTIPPFEDKLRKLIQIWQDEFVSLDRRNKLIHCDPNGRSVVNLLSPDLEGIVDHLSQNSSMEFAWKDALIASTQLDEDEEAPDPKTIEEALETLESVGDFDPVADLLTSLSDEKLASRLRSLRETARTAETEQGISILYLAIGFLRWYESPTSDTEFLSPLLLVPVSLASRGLNRSWSLSPAEEMNTAPIDNRALSLRLRDLQMELPEAPEALDGIPDYLNAVQELINAQPSSRAAIVPDVILGGFPFQKLAMLEDLSANTDFILEQRLVRLLAGDEASQGDISPFASGDSANDFTLRPHDLFTVKDCDHSQLKALAYARDRMDLVIDGPPGTGKSQTITNIIADALARDKKVLFVSEKVAALEVVKNRLSEVGLGDYCLELHSNKQKRKEVLTELTRCLDLPRHQQSVDEDPLSQIEDQRRTINNHAASLHTRPPTERASLFEMLGRLASLQDAADVVCDLSRCMTMDENELQQLRSILESFASHRDLIASGGHHHWSGMLTKSLSLTQKSRLNMLFQSQIPILAEITKATSVIERRWSLPAPCSLAEIAVFADFMQKTSTPLFSVPSSWWPKDKASLSLALSHFGSAEEALRPIFGSLSKRLLAARLPNADAIQVLVEQVQTLRQCLPNSGECTFIEAHQALESITPQLRSLSEAARQAATQSARLVTAFSLNQWRRDNMTIEILGWTMNAIERILDAKGVDPLLLQPQIRSGIEQCRTACEQQLKQAENLQQGLLDTFLPSAFSPEGLAAATAASPYRYWWMRFGQRWKKARQSLGELLTQSKPSLRALFSRLETLMEWHECMRRAEACVASSPLPVPRMAGGLPDFSTLTRDAKLADFLARLKFSSSEVGAACRSVLRTPQQQVREEVASCKTVQRSLNEAWGALPEQIQAVMSGGKDIVGVPFSQLFQAAESVVTQAEPLRKSLFSFLQHFPELSGARIDSLPGTAKAIANLQSACSFLEIHDTDASDDLGSNQPAVELMQSLLAVFPDEIPVLLRCSFACSDHPDPAELTAAFQNLATPAAREVGKFPGELATVVAPPAALGKIGTWRPANALQWAIDLHSQLPTVEEFLTFRSHVDSAKAGGLEVFVEQALRGIPPADGLLSSFDKAYAMQKVDVLTKLLKKHIFNGTQHEQLIDRFRRLDRDSLQLQQARVAALLDKRMACLGTASHPLEASILRTEAARQRGRKKLRQVFAETADLLLRLKPCVMMSPLSVSTFFPGDCEGLRFDLVVIDEASQVRPADAIPAIYRGRQLVVAGDDKQLPPSNFFSRAISNGEEDAAEEESASTAGVESILDMCVASNIHRTRLLWHYRSRHESLIAFSNQQFYDNELVTFPSAHQSGGVEFHHVPDGRWIDNTNPSEAKAVVDLVEQQLRFFPDDSLGIVTFNKAQQELVEDELERLRKRLQNAGGNLDLLARFSEDCREPIFIKNLENVQGDERDCIILSVAYAKDNDGLFAMRFGPLSLAGGERRLNVAITRARKRMQVVSSVHASDFRLNEGSPRGTQLLCSFLRFAEEGASVLEHPAGQSVGLYDSPFEKAVADALRKEGLQIQSQVGCSRFRIDLAARHPQDPTRFVIGIECDGATYHRSAVARDRDRLRQEVLEGLGWRLVRIWSLDWVRNRDRQIAKVMDAYQSALQSADH